MGVSPSCSIADADIQRTELDLPPDVLKCQGDFDCV